MPFKEEHPLYSTWGSMRQRCRNPKNRQWNDYGGRGIDICSRWDDFHAFVEDMGPRPDGYSLDRIDNDAGYSPENCRWADRKTQQRNQRRAVYVEVQGKSYRAIELAEKAGVAATTIVERAGRGLSYEQVVSKTPLRNLKGLSLGGKANGKRQREKTHCPKGHEYTEANTIRSKQGWRRCRVCWNEKEARRRARKAVTS